MPLQGFVFVDHKSARRVVFYGFALLAMICCVLFLSGRPAEATVEELLAKGYGLSMTREPEAFLLNALENVQRERLDQAQVLLEDLIRDNPDFRLAQLVYADVLAARAGALPGLGAGVVPDEELAGLTDEVRRRWLYYQQRPKNGALLPSNLLALGESEPYALVVDLELSRMYVLANMGGGLRIVDDYYVSGGKEGPEKHREGDRRTPLGVYFIQEHIPGNRLPSLYGWGAFTLDYPNPLDRRMGKTGHGIWLHGNPTGTFSRPPQDSDGCVTMHNKDLEALAPLLKRGNVPVVIARRVAWAAPGDLATTREGMLGMLEAWRSDWESLNTEAYLAHYSREFRSATQNYAAWARHKERVNAGKSEIQVHLGNVNLIEYPEAPGLMVATFTQDYWSDNFQSTSRKRQFWKQEGDGQWRIIYEGTY